jgi:anti-sigma B factor antagonist
VPDDAPHSGLALSGWCEGSSLRLLLAGELDIASAADVTTAVEALIEPGMELVLDLDGLTFVDSAGLRTLLRIGEAGTATGFTVRFVALAGAAVRRTAAACDVTATLPLAAH